MSSPYRAGVPSQTPQIPPTHVTHPTPGTAERTITLHAPVRDDQDNRAHVPLQLPKANGEPRGRSEADITILPATPQKNRSFQGKRIKTMAHGLNQATTGLRRVGTSIQHHFTRARSPAMGSDALAPGAVRPAIWCHAPILAPNDEDPHSAAAFRAGIVQHVPARLFDAASERLGLASDWYNEPGQWATDRIDFLLELMALGSETLHHLGSNALCVYSLQTGFRDSAMFAAQNAAAIVLESAGYPAFGSGKEIDPRLLGTMAHAVENDSRFTTQNMTGDDIVDLFAKALADFARGLGTTAEKVWLAKHMCTKSAGPGLIDIRTFIIQDLIDLHLATNRRALV